MPYQLSRWPSLLVISIFLSSCSTFTKPDLQIDADSGKQLIDGFIPTSPDLKLCNTTVSNPPPQQNARILRNRRTACINGVLLDVAPAKNVCLTSGFGPRPPGSSRIHKGIDYQAIPASEIFAAAPGVIIEIGYRQKDLGNWIIIDHGMGVYTSYSHLKSTHSALFKGSRVNKGQMLGIMGSSGNGTNSTHLHYEVRQGQLSNTLNYFQLKPVNPYSLPESCPTKR